MLALLYLFFRGTRLGLAMRAAAANPESARLVGIRVGWMTALGWGMAAAIGAVAGMLIAPVVFLEPNMMLGVLLYGFAGAVLGGLTSPGGAVLGGFAVGVIENLAGTFIPYVGRELKLTIALVLIVAVLMVRPSGLFGRRVVTPGMSAPPTRSPRHGAPARAADRRRADADGAPRHRRSPRSLIVGAADAAVRAQNFFIFQLTLVMVYAIAILGLNLLTGFNGQFSLGHSAFYAIGAYTAAILMDHCGRAVLRWTLPAAGAVCFVVGFLFGLPALRLEGIYLALATFALAIAMPQILKSTLLEHLTGGVQGIVIIKPDPPFGLPLNSDQWLYYFTARGAARDVLRRRESGQQPHRPRDDGDPRQSDRGARDGHQRRALQDR